MPTLQTARGLTKDAQDERVGEIMRAITLPVAMEKGQLLAKALEPATRAETLQLIDAMLVRTLRFFGAMNKGDEHIDKPTRLDIVDAIVDNYPHLNVEEIALVLKKAKAPSGHKDDKVFGKLTGPIIMGWFALHANSEERAGYWENKYQAEKAGRRNDTTLLELVAPLLDMKVGPDGEVEFDAAVVVGREDGEQAESREAAHARALHRQAEYWEQREHERQKEVALGKVKGRLLLDAAALQAATEASWRAYVKEKYYDLRTKAEMDVIRASEKGPLTPTEAAQFQVLARQYQLVQIEWAEAEMAKRDETLNPKA